MAFMVSGRSMRTITTSAAALPSTLTLKISQPFVC
jgi:hypothetical protein